MNAVVALLRVSIGMLANHRRVDGAQFGVR